MSAIKERIIGVIDLMDDKEAALFWNLIQRHYSVKKRDWADIEEVEPDEFDLMLLEEIKNDPDCHTFISSSEAMKQLGL